MAMKTTLCFYGWCPKCKKMHYHPVHGIIDESDLPQACEDCGSDIVWEEATHQSNPGTNLISQIDPK